MSVDRPERSDVPDPHHRSRPPSDAARWALAVATAAGVLVGVVTGEAEVGAEVFLAVLAALRPADRA